MSFELCFGVIIRKGYKERASVNYMSRTYVFRDDKIGVKKGRGSDGEPVYSPVKRGERIDRVTGIKSDTYFAEPSSPYKADEVLSTSKFKILSAKERDMPGSQGGYQLNLLIKEGSREVNYTVYGRDAVGKFKSLMGVGSDSALVGKSVGANIVYKGFKGSDGKMHNANDVSSLEIEVEEGEEEEVEKKPKKKKVLKKKN